MMMMAKKIKLSKLQQDVIDKLREGWELGLSMTMDGGAWMQKDGLGRGGESMNVKKNTFFALRDKGIIKRVSENFPTARYVLTDEWAKCCGNCHFFKHKPLTDGKDPNAGICLDDHALTAITRKNNLGCSFWKREG